MHSMPTNGASKNRDYHAKMGSLTDSEDSRGSLKFLEVPRVWYGYLGCEYLGYGHLGYGHLGYGHQGYGHIFFR